MSQTEAGYDQSLEGAGPTVEIQVEAPGGVSRACTAVIDTGVRVSAVPNPLLTAINAAPVGSVRIRTAVGDERKVNRYGVTVTLGDIKKEVQVLGLDTPVALLGRDFLFDCDVYLGAGQQAPRVRRLARLRERISEAMEKDELDDLLPPARIKDVHLHAGPDYDSIELVFDLSGVPGQVVRLDTETAGTTATTPPAISTLYDKVFIHGENEEDAIRNFDALLRDKPLRLVQAQ